MKSSMIVAGLAVLSLSACTTMNAYTGDQQLSSTAGGAMIGAGTRRRRWWHRRRSDGQGSAHHRVDRRRHRRPHRRGHRQIHGSAGSRASCPVAGHRRLGHPHRQPDHPQHAVQHHLRRRLRDRPAAVQRDAGLGRPGAEEVQQDHHRRLRPHRQHRLGQLQPRPVAEARRLRRRDPVGTGRSISAASMSPARANPIRSRRTRPRPAARRTAASRSSFRPSRVRRSSWIGVLRRRRWRAWYDIGSAIATQHLQPKQERPRAWQAPPGRSATRPSGRCRRWSARPLSPSSSVESSGRSSRRPFSSTRKSASASTDVLF